MENSLSFFDFLKKLRGFSNFSIYLFLILLVMKKVLRTLLVVLAALAFSVFVESCSKEDFGPQTMDESSEISQKSNTGWLTKADVLSAKQLAPERVNVADSNGNLLYSYEIPAWFSLSLRKYYGVDDKGRNLLSSKMYTVSVPPDVMMELRSFMLDKNLALVYLYTEFSTKGFEKEIVGGIITSGNN